MFKVNFSIYTELHGKEWEKDQLQAFTESPVQSFAEC